jgi:hypothetical protein
MSRAQKYLDQVREEDARSATRVAAISDGVVRL